MVAEYRPTVRELPASERPRERLQSSGPAALSNHELLAIILRSGTAGENVVDLSRNLLVHFNGLTGLARASLGELTRYKGLGPAKACEILAAVELAKRLAAGSPEARLQVRNPADVANLLLLDMGTLSQEVLKVVLLDTKNRVVHVQQVYQGSVNTTQLRTSEIFKQAVIQNCPALIVVHNHPSGDPTPSPEDVRVTEQLVAAGKLLDIEVVDHLVIGEQRYVSLRERGLGFG